MEAIITSLVFDHALHARLTSSVVPAWTSKDIETDTTGDPSGNDDLASLLDAPETTATSSTTEACNKREPTKDWHQIEANNVGKILDLVTADLDNIAAGREFLCAGDLPDSLLKPLH
jgi:hypothetical protein